MGSGVSGLNFPQTSGLAFWASSNILNYDSDIIWDTTNNRLGIQQSSPSYSIDIGGAAEASSVQASGFYVVALVLYSLLLAVTLVVSSLCILRRTKQNLQLVQI